MTYFIPMSECFRWGKLRIVSDCNEIRWNAIVQLKRCTYISTAHWLATCQRDCPWSIWVNCPQSFTSTLFTSLASTPCNSPSASAPSVHVLVRAQCVQGENSLFSIAALKDRAGSHTLASMRSWDEDLRPWVRVISNITWMEHGLPLLSCTMVYFTRARFEGLVQVSQDQADTHRPTPLSGTDAERLQRRPGQAWVLSASTPPCVLSLSSTSSSASWRRRSGHRERVPPCPSYQV